MHGRQNFLHDLNSDWKAFEHVRMLKKFSILMIKNEILALNANRLVKL